MDNSVERDKQVEGQFPDLVANFKLLVTNVEKLKNSHKSLKQEVSRLQVERDKAIEQLKWINKEIYWGDAENAIDKVVARNNSVLSELGVPHETT